MGVCLHMGGGKIREISCLGEPSERDWFWGMRRAGVRIGMVSAVQFLPQLPHF